MSRTLVFSVVLLGCGSSDPKPDAAVVTHDAQAVDAAAAVCTMANECPCFSNDDCPASTRCHAADETHVYCTPGARGTGAAGATCTGEDDCASALCVDGTDTTRCSKTCTSDTECPTELPRCLGGIGICARSV